jgi:hypothetical protein
MQLVLLIRLIRCFKDRVEEALNDNGFPSGSGKKRGKYVPS